MAKLKLTLKLADLRADIADAFEEGTEENDEVTEVLHSLSPNGEDLEVEVDTAAGTAVIL